MPPKFMRRRKQGLYYHSTAPRVIPAYGRFLIDTNVLRQQPVHMANDGFNIKPSNIRIWIHDKDIAKLTRVLWSGQGFRLLNETSTSAKVRKFLENVPLVLNTIRDIHSAVIENNIENLQFLLELPPQAIITTRDQNGLTVIHKAAGLGHTQMLDILVKFWPKGAQEVDRTGKTPLHWSACSKDCAAIQEMLLQNSGVQEDVLDYRMKTPAYYRNKPQELEKAFLTELPNAPRIMKNQIVDWSIIEDDIGDLNGMRPTEKIVVEKKKKKSIEKQDSDYDPDLEERNMKTFDENGNIAKNFIAPFSNIIENDKLLHVGDDDHDDHRPDVNPDDDAALLKDNNVETINDDVNNNKNVLNGDGLNDFGNELALSHESSPSILPSETPRNSFENTPTTIEPIETPDIEVIHTPQMVQSAESLKESPDINTAPEESNLPNHTAVTPTSTSPTNLDDNLDKNFLADKLYDNYQLEISFLNSARDRNKVDEEITKDNNDETKDKNNDEKTDENNDKNNETTIGKELNNNLNKEETEPNETKDNEIEDENENAVEDQIQEHTNKEQTEHEEKGEENQELNETIKVNKNENYDTQTNNNKNEEKDIENDEITNENEQNDKNTKEIEQNDENTNENEQNDENTNKIEQNDENTNENEQNDENTNKIEQNYENTNEIEQSDENKNEIEQNDENVNDNEQNEERKVENENENIENEEQTEEDIQRIKNLNEQDDKSIDIRNEDSENDDENSLHESMEQLDYEGSTNGTHNESFRSPSSPSTSHDIEGFIQEDPDDNQVQSQSSDLIVDDKAKINQIIQAGDMEKLASIVLNGDGNKLLGTHSSEPEIQAFLDNVPTYMSKIQRVHQAARDGNLKELQTALDRRKFAIARTEISPNGTTPLHVSTIFGHSVIVRYLAGRFPETTTSVDEDGRTPLHYAATINDNGHFYNLLVHFGSNPKATDKLGNTPENYKDQKAFGHILSHKQLLKTFGANEKLDTEMLSDQETKSNIESNMLNNSSNINKSHSERQIDIPLFKTEQGQYLSTNLGDPLVKALTEIADKRPEDPIIYLINYLQDYVNMRDKNRSGKGPVNGITNNHHMNGIVNHSGMGLENSAIPSKPDAPKLKSGIGSRQASANDNNDFGDDDSSDSAGFDEDRDEHGQSMLHFACARSHGRNALISLIEESNIDITYRDELYRTARDVSLQANQPGNAKEIDRYILSLAANGDDKPFVHMLLNGYDHILDVEDGEGNTIFDICRIRGSSEITRLLEKVRSFEETREEIHAAIRSNKPDIVEELTIVAIGPQLIKAKNYYGRTSLHIAILKENLEIIEYIVQNFPDIIKIGDNLERTALHYAMGISKVEEVSRILISKGAKRTAKDLKGRQPSYYFINKSDILRLQEEESEDR